MAAMKVEMVVTVAVVVRTPARRSDLSTAA